MGAWSLHAGHGSRFLLPARITVAVGQGAAERLLSWSDRVDLLEITAGEWVGGVTTKLTAA